MKNPETAARIVDRILEEINTSGSLPWAKPWSADKTSVKIIDGVTTIEIPCRFWSRSGKAYSGVNVLLLAMSGKEGEFITFNQCKAEGGKVKKGAKGFPIIYWNMYRKETEELDENGNKRVIMIPNLKYYTVFSISDCEGIEQKNERPAPEIVTIPKWHYEPVEGIDPNSYDAAAEAIIADYLHRAQTLTLDCMGESDRAFYAPYADSVTVPNINQFGEVSEYYSTLFHELGHSTGHSSRLNRFTGNAANAAFGSEEYSKEELVAEITAATILNSLGLESGNTFRNSAAYVQSWSKHIKDDPMMFISAAGKADKAVNMILGIETTSEAA